MLRTFAAALLATALIGGPALAASPSGNGGNSAATAAAPNATAAQPVKTTNPVKHVRAHPRKHQRFARHHGRTVKMVRHIKPVKHRHRVAAHKVTKATRT